jgi:hypothetical protein
MRRWSDDERAGRGTSAPGSHVPGFLALSSVTTSATAIGHADQADTVEQWRRTLCVARPASRSRWGTHPRPRPAVSVTIELMRHRSANYGANISPSTSSTFASVAWVTDPNRLTNRTRSTVRIWSSTMSPAFL